MRALATVAMLVSVDDERGPQLYKIDPAGHYFPYKVSKQNTSINIMHLKIIALMSTITERVLADMFPLI